MCVYFSIVENHPVLYELVENETPPRPIVLNVLTKDAMVEFLMYLANTERFGILKEMENNGEVSSFDLYHAKYCLMAKMAPALDRIQRRYLYRNCQTFASLSQAIIDYVRPNSPYTLNDVVTKYRT